MTFLFGGGVGEGDLLSSSSPSSPLGVGRILLSQVDASPLAGLPLAPVAPLLGARFSLSESKINYK